MFSTVASDWLFVSLYVCQPIKMQLISFVFLHWFTSLPMALLFKELRDSVVCLAFVINIYYFWLIKITKVTEVKQMLQISYSEVFLAICSSWMITINRAYVYKKYLNTRSIMTWLYCKSSSADIISKKNQFSFDATEPKTIFICKKILSVPS